ncbi:MAG: dihydroneopterin aldolase [Cyclobacteriaceae bacterium]|jgi:dihydroneopterin aldolase|nr:dihydroneopterin aldolase [Cyclobacteriaceae bacterium]
MKGTIILEGLEFHAYHGVYPHERSSGNKFEVDLAVQTEIQETAFADDLSGTLNYEDLYALVKAEMEKPSKLLERVAHAIAASVLRASSQALAAEVKISKFNPPIGGVCKKASVVVTLRKP